ncbi:MAG: polyprenyl synthetase family protein [Verrucomicrobiae bacterium]|nr:polyprenyl synthetase family protein [Verrucomicrobiae bacterium]
MLAAGTKVAGAAATGTHDSARGWKRVTEPVEQFLAGVTARLAEEVREFDSGLAAYAEYALTGQGKQLRPALLGLSAQATGGLNESHVTAAVIVEMVHLATLVHDDVMDEAEIRRGRLTFAANWGNETAVLFGDCLFAQALQLAASYPTPDVCRAVAAATKRVCSGEILQNHQRNSFDLPQDEYLRVLEMKTGELFALACELGAFLNGAPATAQSALRKFGLALGTAYQLYDDCLDVFGTEAEAGKSLGTDLVKGKPTLPVLLFWEHATAAQRQELRELLAHWAPGTFNRLQAMLSTPQTLRRAALLVEKHLRAACDALSGLGAGKQGLIELADYLRCQARTLCARAAA